MQIFVSNQSLVLQKVIFYFRLLLHPELWLWCSGDEDPGGELHLSRQQRGGGCGERTRQLSYHVWVIVAWVNILLNDVRVGQTKTLFLPIWGKKGTNYKKQAVLRTLSFWSQKTIHFIMSKYFLNFLVYKDFLCNLALAFITFWPLELELCKTCTEFPANRFLF